MHSTYPTQRSSTSASAGPAFVLSPALHTMVPSCGNARVGSHSIVCLARRRTSRCPEKEQT
eukprot:scaffold8844_cov55-Phaeocystis_antarctica.AAC.1